MPAEELTDYAKIVSSVESKYRKAIDGRHFDSPSGFMRLISFAVEQVISLLVLFPFSRITYVKLMNANSSPQKLRDLMSWGTRKAAINHPQLAEVFGTGKALIVYFSTSGNTEKVALAVAEGIRKAGLEPVLKKVSEAFDEELYDYDLVCVGTPVIHGLPPHPVMRFILEKGSEYRKRHEVRINAQTIPGKNALVFVTFSGPHIGVEEAIPSGKYLRQSLHHMGFDVKGEWYIVGEFHGWEDGSTRGKMGDIRGRPNAEDLRRIEEKTTKLVNSLKS